MSPLRSALPAALLLLSLATPAGTDATTISGRVSDAVSKNSIPGAAVHVAEFWPDPFFSADTITDVGGHYEFNVPQGFPEVTVQATGYVPQRQFLQLDATPLIADFELALASSIQGTIRGAGDGNAIANARVTLFDAGSKAYITETRTDANGGYAFPLLLAGSYAVCVIDSTDVYLDACYDQIKIGPDGVLAFTAIPLESDQDMTAVDIGLSEGAPISGTLRDGYDGSLLVGTPMDLYVYSAQQGYLFDLAVVTDESGGYAIRGLPAGDYYLEAAEAFDGHTVNSRYSPRFYGCNSAACTLEDATPVHVPAAGTTGIDIAPYPGFMVTGRVTDAATNVGIAGVTVQSCEYFYMFFTGVTSSTVTDATGNYVLKHLIGSNDSSPHIATVDTPGYFNVVWPNATLASPATFCAVATGGSVVSGFTTPDQTAGPIDFALLKGAAISGTLKAADVPDATVPGFIQLFSYDGQTEHLISTVDTDADGNYATVGVPAGTYFVVAYAGGCSLYGDGSCEGPGAQDNSYAIDFGNGSPIILADQESKTGIDVHVPVRIFAAGFE